jgi:hypothetical protein
VASKIAEYCPKFVLLRPDREITNRQAAKNAKILVRFLWRSWRSWRFSFRATQKGHYESPPPARLSHQSVEPRPEERYCAFFSAALSPSVFFATAGRGGGGGFGVQNSPPVFAHSFGT